MKPRLMSAPTESSAEREHFVAPREELPRTVRTAMAVLILAGLALRVVVPGTTYYCCDQAYASALADDIVAGHLQTAGLRNSGGFRNLPGFVYVLAAVRGFSPDPAAQAMFIAWVNVLAVAAAAALMRRWIGGPGAWWATTFLATAPWAIHYSRFVWAQNLLFPAALVAYGLLWLWLEQHKRWATAGVVLALTLLVQIHLIGVVLVLAVALYLLWCRPRLPLAPIAVAATLAMLSVLPYLLDGHLAAPRGQRFGIQHFWRVIAGGAMSVSGLGWQLAFYEGLPRFRETLGERCWLYDGVMLVPVLLLGIGGVLGMRKLWVERSQGLLARRAGLPMCAALLVLIPLSFDLFMLRTSPTYMAMWYPLPFVLMGWAVTQLPSRAFWRGPVSVGLLLVAGVQVTFFAEQLRYMHVHGGVPGSLVGRTLVGAQSDVAALATHLDAAEIWAIYDGPSAGQGDAATYLLRHAPWKGGGTGRVLVRFRWWQSWDDLPGVERLADDATLPQNACLVYPWEGRQQRGGRIPCRAQ